VLIPWFVPLLFCLGPALCVGNGYGHGNGVKLPDWQLGGAQPSEAFEAIFQDIANE